jgi:hypothetical protein
MCGVCVVRDCREIGKLRSKVVLQGNRDWKFGEMPCWKETWGSRHSSLRKSASQLAVRCKADNLRHSLP